MHDKSQAAKEAAKVATEEKSATTTTTATITRLSQRIANLEYQMAYTSLSKKLESAC